MTMMYGLSGEVLNSIRSVLKGYHGLRRAILYGSRAKDTFKKGSDIDITLDAPSMTFADLLRIESQLDALDLPYNFDVSIYQHLELPALIDHIERVGKVIV